MKSGRILKHRHRWRESSLMMGPEPTISFRCKHPHCTAERERPQTKAEIKRNKAYFKKQRQETRSMHHVWHEFQRRFLDKKEQWKLKGFDLERTISRWSKKYPKDVIELGCDDDCHASSRIFLILHRIKRRLWGTSVVVVTQCDGKPPKSFFLYPEHAHELAKALRVLEMHAPYFELEPYERAEKKRRRKLWR